MLALVYLILSFIIAFLEITRKKETLMDFLTLFNIYYFLFYVLPGLILAIDLKNAITLDHWSNMRFNTNNVETAFAIFIGYLLIVASFYSKLARKYGQNIVIKFRQSSIIYIYAIFLCLFAMLALYITTLPLGGIFAAIAKSSAFRAGEESSGDFGFFTRFLSAATFACYILLAYYVSTKNYTQGRFPKLFWFIVSFITAFTGFLTKAGRFNIIAFLFGFYQIYILRNKKIPWITSIIFIITMSLFLLYGKPLFASLSALPDGLDAVIERFNELNTSGNREGFDFYEFMNNFYYPLFSLDTALTKDGYELRWFSDIIYGFLSLIPKVFLGGVKSPPSILYYNSVYILGPFDSEGASVPTGILAFGIYSMWWPGLVIICLFYGWIGGLLQTILNKYLNSIFWMPHFYTIVAQQWAIFMTADPETFLQSQFMLLISCCFLLLIGCKFDTSKPVRKYFHQKDYPD
jgi:hypothetical protein